jgi:hypothetical protein
MLLYLKKCIYQKKEISQKKFTYQVEWLAFNTAYIEDDQIAEEEKDFEFLGGGDDDGDKTCCQKVMACWKQKSYSCCQKKFQISKLELVNIITIFVLWVLILFIGIVTI